MANKYLDQITKGTIKRKSIPRFDVPLDNSALKPMDVLDADTYNQLMGASNVISDNAAAQDVMSEGFGFTPGDYLGMGSTLAGGILQIMNTVEAAKATKPNVNRFKGFAEEAIRTNKEIQDEIKRGEQAKKRDVERKLKSRRKTMKEQGRASASGISQARALDLAADLQTNEAEISAFNELESIFGNQMLQALGREQDLLVQQDQAEMSAQERMDIADQQDLDNFYTNFAQNLASLTESGQKLGSDINKAKYREDFLSILPETNRWGVGFEYQSGRPVMTTKKYNTNAGTSITEAPIEPSGFNSPLLLDLENEVYDF